MSTRLHLLCCAALALAGCRAGVADEPPAAPSGPSAPAPASPPDLPAPPPSPAPPPAPATCAAGVPAAACDQLRAFQALHPAQSLALSACAAADPARVGEWSYAVVAPLYTATESLSVKDLAAKWTAGELDASADTQAALAPLLGSAAAPPIAERPGGRPDVAPRWAIVPAHELAPAWQVVAVDGKHPLADAAAQPLAVPLCAAPRPPASPALAIRNVDPGRLTVLAMTGTTAMTRNMMALLDHKGTSYPAKDVAAWFAAADFVHVSNEVSFVPSCKVKLDQEVPEFCSRERYIELLEAIHANVIELTGSHLSDFGSEWIDHTLDMYKQRGWRWFGGGHDQIQATTPLVFDHHGNHFALLGCNMVRTTSHLIVDNHPDTAACDLRRMDWQIRDLRARGIVPIVSIQHEEVYHHDPPDVIVTDFRRLAADGAELVFGSQAHCAHPWEVHDGAFLHYGAGNFFFDQDAPLLRDGTADKLYLYANHLLAVGHLYTRLEEKGRPRPQTDRERADYLATLAKTLAKLPRAAPWAPNHLAPPERQHADSLWQHRDNQPMWVYVPAAADASLLPGGGRTPDAAATFGLVVYLHREDLSGGTLDKLLSRGLPAQLAKPDATETRFVVSPHLRPGESWTQARIDRFTQFMLAKYPIDPAQVTVQRE